MKSMHSRQRNNSIPEINSDSEESLAIKSFNNSSPKNGIPVNNFIKNKKKKIESVSSLEESLSVADMKSESPLESKTQSCIPNKF